MCWVSALLIELKMLFPPFFCLTIFFWMWWEFECREMLGWLEEPSENFYGAVSLESKIGAFRELFVSPAVHKVWRPNSGPDRQRYPGITIIPNKMLHFRWWSGLCFYLNIHLSSYKSLDLKCCEGTFGADE